MKVRRIAVILFLGALVAVLNGCQQEAADDVAGGRDVPADSSVQQRSPAVELSSYLPALDDGRVEIAPPEGWRVMPRNRNFLTRFYTTDINGLPRIEVKVEDRGYGKIQTVTADSVEQFAKFVAANLKAQGKKPVEPVIGMVLSEVPCARYVTSLKLKMGQTTISAERQRLLVLHGGRLYTLDLTVLPATLKRSRDAAYAVCSGLRFVAADTPSVADDDNSESTETDAAETGGDAGADSDTTTEPNDDAGK